MTESGRSPIRRAVKVPVDLLAGLLDGDPVGGALAAVLLLGAGLGAIFLALGLITRNMRQLVAGGVKRAMNRVIGTGGGAVGILVGVVVTVAVQSSSITTSILIPLVAAGVLSLPNAYPITLGANVGTTTTALLASLAVLRPEGLTIALVHTLFNVTALALVYPVERIRLLPVAAATWLAEIASVRHALVFAYVSGLFILVPLAGVFLLD